MGYIIKIQEQLSCLFADHVITVSEHWRQALIRRGVPEQKCSVIMNVADDTIFRPYSELEARPARSDHFRLIYHGSIHERYGLDLAIQAIDQVRSEIPNIHLTLVGQGEYLSHIEKMIAERGLNQYVTIESLHLVEELPGIIQSCDLGIVPYRNDVFTDGLLPTKLMEYAALGLPAIASRTSTIYAYFNDTNTEFFEPGNADDFADRIRSLYAHPDRLAELARDSHKFNQRYNWTKVGAEYVALVEQIGQRKIRTRKDRLQQHPGS
jgi:glycosyltransferase involved in cell wall biosynthesis